MIIIKYHKVCIQMCVNQIPKLKIFVQIVVVQFNLIQEFLILHYNFTIFNLM